jgi:segregation and condensation protein A
MASSLDINKMVTRPSWKTILLELIESDKIDPWNIDILEISDAFLKRVREMEKLDLLIQANVILAAAILLRHKSNYLKFLQYQEQMTDYIPEEPIEPLPADDIPQLTMASRIPPKRQVTLEELVEEVEKVIKYDSEERLLRKPKGSIDEVVEFKLEEQDIERRMNEVAKNIRNSVDPEGWTLFSRVIKDKQDNIELIYALMSILHLTQKQTIDIKQDELFGEIFIKLLDAKKQEI